MAVPVKSCATSARAWLSCRRRRFIAFAIGHDTQEYAEAKFKEISEAYEALSDPDKRKVRPIQPECHVQESRITTVCFSYLALYMLSQIYDMYGEEGLKAGVSAEDGALCDTMIALHMMLRFRSQCHS